MTALTWRVKASLVDYILTAAGGTVELVGTAERLDDGVYRFAAVDDTAGLPVAPGDDPLRFEGGVHLRGHGGMLDLALTGIWIERDDKGYALSIVDPDDDAQRVTFARIAGFTEGSPRRAETTTLTLDGADLFFGPYQEGTEFDDPTVTFS